MKSQSTLSLRHCVEHLLLPPTLRLLSAPRILLRHSPPQRPIHLRRRGTHVPSASSCGDETRTPASSDGLPRAFAMEEAVMGFIGGERKAVEVVHSVWRKVLEKGHAAVDATCGNGYDSLELLRSVAPDDGSSDGGVVYALDIQKPALEKTSSLLDRLATEKQRGSVKLFQLCHSRMEEVVPRSSSVKVIAFNLGYLPGGDKSVITSSRTTLLALEAASRILGSGGVISLVVYVGHPGGREEFEAVRSFASRMPTDGWVCCVFEVANRPLAPVLVLIFRK